MVEHPYSKRLSVSIDQINLVLGNEDEFLL